MQYTPKCVPKNNCFKINLYYPGNLDISYLLQRRVAQRSFVARRALYNTTKFSLQNGLLTTHGLFTQTFTRFEHQLWQSSSVAFLRSTEDGGLPCQLQRPSYPLRAPRVLDSAHKTPDARPSPHAPSASLCTRPKVRPRRLLQPTTYARG